MNEVPGAGNDVPDATTTRGESRDERRGEPRGEPGGEPGAGPRRIRRRLLQTLSVAPIGKGLLGGGAALAMPAVSLAATPACGGAEGPTPRQTEGPYFTRNSPLRGSLLEAEIGGTRLVLSGTVRGLDCAALAGVLLDFWQADAEGVYDNRGYRLRGHQFTDAAGRYRLETVLPGFYPGRTRHIHVKVQAREGPVLTTQLYFPGEARNRSDAIFSPALLVSLAQAGAAPGADLSSGPDTTGSAATLSGTSGMIDASFDFAIRTA